MSADARLVEVCDAVAEKLRAVNPGLNVRRRYTFKVPKGGPAVPTVWVMPVGYEQAQTVTRGCDEYAFTVGVAMAQRIYGYPRGAENADDGDEADDADLAAVDALLAFVQRQLFEPIENARAVPVLPAPCADCWPQGASVPVAFDPDLLANGVFYSELLFTFHELTEG